VKKQRIELLVSVELDPFPGDFHTAESAAEGVAAILTGQIAHYDPQVKLASPPCEPFTVASTRAREACDYITDGEDTDGTLWHRCITHGELAPSDEAPCDGYEPEPYTHVATQAERLSAAKIALLALIDRTIGKYEGDLEGKRVVQEDWVWGSYHGNTWVQTNPAPIAILWEEGPDDWPLTITMGDHHEEVWAIQERYEVMFEAITSWALGIFDDRP
jgi:hypothetical protein